jgi:hypothetical protein
MSRLPRTTLTLTSEDLTILIEALSLKMDQADRLTDQKVYGQAEELWSELLDARWTCK